jgi:spermidine synthase
VSGQRRTASANAAGEQAPVIGCSHGRRALLVGGTVQSVAPDDAAGGYWSAMLPVQPPLAALLLGFGGGTVAHLLMRRFGEVAITGVDESAEVLRLARERFGAAGPSMTIVQADAFAFVQDCEQQYDFIAVDLYRGHRLARGVLALPFLRRLTALLRQGGTVAFNLFRDELLPGRLARLERAFETVQRREIGANVVVHARPRVRYR